MINLSELKDLVEANYVDELSTGSYASIEEKLNNKDIQVNSIMNLESLEKYLMDQGILLTLNLSTDLNAKQVLLLLDSKRVNEIEVTPTVILVINNLNNLGLITNTNKDFLLNSLAQKRYISLAEQTFGRGIYINHMTIAEACSETFNRSFNAVIV